MKIIGIDPGETTGLAIYSTYDDWSFKQVGPQEHHLALWGFLTQEKPDIIVFERFENRGNQAARLISLEYIGVVKLWASFNQPNLVMQSASQAKGFWTNDKLKACSLWKGTSLKHAMDATRHVLYYLMQTKQLPVEYTSALRTLAEA